MSNAITKQRSEIKYLISAEKRHALRKIISQQIPEHCFLKGKELTLISTVYFDTVNLNYYKQAVQDPYNNTKIRAREYYYFNKDMVEHALSMDSLFEYSDILWLEIKERKNQESFKKRVKISKSVFTGQQNYPTLVEKIVADNPEQNLNDSFSQILNQICAGALQPAAVVNYKRNAFQTDDASLRISLDTGVGYYKVPDGFFKAQVSLTRENLPLQTGSEPMTILEIKYTDQLPEWLKSPLKDLSPTNFSKFSSCMNSICSGWV
jgi:SPX domain protein involved in polyphosphate accumulation